ncbi:hypothetical protein PF005_g16088 [Phytophthora fragariae]|uniref:Uncharacterized protein n=1 Tax=Phytophthora fragariae TaxID=53985 RepID=A0A6A3XG42_9STRA|nr:hypothetical protein PF003_g28466 [Phytophthora fragariae]KAE8931330.1 hypothetical protein PF009_g18611 [Phytophthora fragariae]KAE8995481.1 hypothetical protein PF011_g16311 [Phytophthora fragariae]KAE9095013.1 hypothetical protein PF007_g17556 [Phytophthora fragariae]KAE9097958.1 hypothetical protein PF010_g15753 [Phytophthora fragariae]
MPTCSRHVLTVLTGGHGLRSAQCCCACLPWLGTKARRSSTGMKRGERLGAFNG